VAGFAAGLSRQARSNSSGEGRGLERSILVESVTMKVTIDKDADALYMRLSDTQIHDSEEVKPGVILDYDDQDNLIGIEILRVSERVPRSNLKSVLIESEL